MKIKTYRYPGLREWHGVLNAGGIRMKVSFTGGSATAFGVCHAEFTTRDELTQFVIEHSDKFKNGTIYLERTTVIGEEAIDHSPLASPKTLTLGETSELDRSRSTASLTIDHSSIDHESLDIGQEGAEDDAIKVADKSEAIEWLKEHYPDKGYTQRGLRSKADFDAACQECGVRFSY